MMKKSTIWLYWLITDITLAIGLMYWTPALYLSMLIVAVHSLHKFRDTRRLTAFPMQVRLVYLGLLIQGQAPYFEWINWIQLAGTTALLVFDYCPLARMLSLLSWNRSQQLSWKYFRTVIFSRPFKGSVIQAVSPELVERLHPELNPVISQPINQQGEV